MPSTSTRPAAAVWMQASPPKLAAVASWVNMIPEVSPVRRKSNGAQRSARKHTTCEKLKIEPTRSSGRPR